MSTYAEQPFTEFEERYFLAEILKKSNLPPTALLAIIRDARIDPAWSDIALPNGRSVSACQQAFNSLYSRTPLQPPQHSPLGPGPVDTRGLKRPYSSLGDANMPLTRELQPRPPAPSAFTSVNGQQIAIAPPQPMMMSPVEPQRKKRGRPTKAEWERRQAEAQERGEVWPKPRKAKPRPSTESVESSKASAVQTTALPDSPAARMEGVTPGSAPTAIMSSPAAGGPPPPPPPPPSSSQPPTTQAQQLHTSSIERRNSDQPPAPVHGLGSERSTEHPAQPSHAGPGQEGAPPPQYHYGPPPPGEGGPVEHPSQRGFQRRDDPHEQRQQLHQHHLQQQQPPPPPSQQRR